MNARLPSLGTLLAFEASAQTKNFANAAKQLHVTPAAISQKILSLETHLGVKLFIRSKMGVQLTRAGESYLVFVLAGLDKLRLGQQQLKSFNNLNVLTITTLPSVAQKWLMPLVLEWMDLHPELEIRIEASHNKVDFKHSASDMCISFGNDEFTGLYKEELLLDYVSMVLSPKLASTLEDASDLDELLSLPMIHVDWGEHNESLPQWKDWLAKVAEKTMVIHNGPRFNLSSMAIEAAVKGKGLLMGQQLLIEKELAAGSLISPVSLRLPLGKAYYLVYPQRTFDNPKAFAFIAWLKTKVRLQILE